MHYVSIMSMCDLAGRGVRCVQNIVGGMTQRGMANWSGRLNGALLSCGGANLRADADG